MKTLIEKCANFVSEYYQGIIGTGGTAATISLTAITDFIQQTILIFAALLVAIATLWYWVWAIRAKSKDMCLKNVEMELKLLKKKELELQIKKLEDGTV